MDATEESAESDESFEIIPDETEIQNETDGTDVFENPQMTALVNSVDYVFENNLDSERCIKVEQPDCTNLKTDNDAASVPFDIVQSSNAFVGSLMADKLQHESGKIVEDSTDDKPPIQAGSEQDNNRNGKHNEPSSNTLLGSLVANQLQHDLEDMAEDPPGSKPRTTIQIGNKQDNTKYDTEITQGSIASFSSSVADKLHRASNDNVEDSTNDKHRRPIQAENAQDKNEHGTDIVQNSNKTLKSIKAEKINPESRELVKYATDDNTRTAIQAGNEHDNTKKDVDIAKSSSVTLSSFVADKLHHASDDNEEDSTDDKPRTPQQTENEHEKYEHGADILQSSNASLRSMVKNSTDDKPKMAIHAGNEHEKYKHVTDIMESPIVLIKANQLNQESREIEENTTDGKTRTAIQSGNEHDDTEKDVDIAKSSSVYLSSFVADKLHHALDDNVEDLTDDKPRTAIQAENDHEKYKPGTDIAQSPNVSIKADPLNQESREMVENETGDKTRTAIPAGNEHDIIEYDVEIAKNSNTSFSSFVSDKLLHASEEIVKDSTNDKPATFIQTGGDQVDKINGMNTIYNSSSVKSLEANELQHESNEKLNSSTHQSSSNKLFAQNGNNELVENDSGSKVMKKDKLDVSQQGSNEAEDNLLPNVISENRDRIHFVEKRFRIEKTGALYEEKYEKSDISRMYWMSYRILLDSNETKQVLEKDLQALKVSVGINQESKNPCIYFQVYKDIQEMEDCNKSVMRIMVQNVKKYIRRYRVQFGREYAKDVLAYTKTYSEIQQNHVDIYLSHEDGSELSQLEVVGMRRFIPLVLFNLLHRLNAITNVYLFDGDTSLKVEIKTTILSEDHYKLFQMFDISSIIERDYPKAIVQAEDNNKRFYIVEPIGEADSVCEALLSLKWLEQIPHKRCQMIPSFLVLLQNSETSQFIHSKLKSQTGKYAWLRENDDSIVIYADSSELVSSVIGIIRSSLIKETIPVTNGEQMTKYIQSTDWQERIKRICSRNTGKIDVHIENGTHGLIDVTIVGTNDVTMAIKDFVTELESIFANIHNEQPMSMFSKTVEMDPYQFQWICATKNVLDSICPPNVDIIELNDDKQKGFIVNGNDGDAVNEISNKISDYAKNIKRKQLLINQRLAILTLQKSNYRYLNYLATRYGCLIFRDTTDGAALPYLRVEQDRVATRGRWFIENGCEICLTLKEPELCQVDVLVEADSQEVIQEDKVPFSPEKGLLNQAIIKISLSWKDGRNGEKDKLHKLLQNVFSSATSLGHRSFAFWVDHFCGWPYKTFCKCLIFSLKQMQDGTIEKVFFCCQDENICKNITEIIESAGLKDSPTKSGKICIEIVEGELAKQKVDIIVNTTGKLLDLKNGAVSTSVCLAAGKGMQQEIRRQYPNGIDYGDIAVTESYKLGCKTVLHCALYAWADNGKEQQKCRQTLQMCMTKCLQEADKRKHKSIAFPVLGTGNLEVPVKDAAECMINAIKSYQNSQTKTSVTTVKIVVYNDKKILKTFHEMLEQLGGNKTEPQRTAQQNKILVDDLPSYKSPLTIEIIGPEDSISHVIAEIDKFERCPRQVLTQNLTNSKVDYLYQTVASDASVATTHPSPVNTPEDFSTKINHSPQTLGKFPNFSLLKTEDVRCCLVAVKLPNVDDIKCIIERELESKQCQPLHVLYPYEIPSQALIIYICSKDAEYAVGQSFKNFDIEELPAQVLCNIEAEIDPDFLSSLSTVEDRNLLKKRLIEKSGVAISDVYEGKTWILKGLRFQIEIALDFLRSYLDNSKRQSQDSKCPPEVQSYTHSTENTPLEDDATMPISADDTGPFASRDSQTITKPYNTVTKQSGFEKESKTEIEFRKLENISLVDYLAFQFFFQKELLCLLKDNITVEYDLETRTISMMCKRQNIDTVFDAVQQSVYGLKSYCRENVPYIQDFESRLTLVHSEICKVFPDLFCYISEESKEVCFIGKNRDDVTRAISHFQFLLGERGVFDNTCQVAIPNFGNVRKGSMFVTSSGLYIHVYQANILNLQVQCIVNAANCKLDHGGGVAQIISKASGAVIAKQSKAFIKKHGELKVGSACYTLAGKLKYDYVIHTVGPRWSDYKTEQELERQRCAYDLQRAMQSAINTADQLGMISIGIPPVSAGTYGVPKDICANSYASGVFEASNLLTSKSTLKEVHIIDKDSEMVQLITRVFRDYFTESNPTCNNDQSLLSEDRRKRSQRPDETHYLPQQQKQLTQMFYPIHTKDQSTGVLMHVFQLSENSKVYIYTRSFENVNAQALVCGQDIYFENKGAVAEGIRKFAGDAYGSQIEEVRKQKNQFNIGEVVCLQGGEWIMYILHVVTPKWKVKGNSKQNESFFPGISKCFANVLKRAAELRIHTIAVPLLGTGTKGCPTKKVAEILLNEILAFINSTGPSCTINEIHVVNKSPDTTKLVVSLFDEYVSSEWKRLYSAA